jgi:PBSX family phage portal protein
VSKDAPDHIELEDGGQLVEVNAYFLGNINRESIGKSDTSQVRFKDDELPGDLQPIYDYPDASVLSEIPMSMGILQSCAEAMEVNVDGRGYELKRRVPEDKLTDPEKAAADAEYERLRSLFDRCNARQSFTKLRKELRQDMEKTGRCAIEVVRDRKGEIREFHRISPIGFYMTKRDKKFTEFEQPIRDPLTGEYKMQVRKERFRRFLQVINGKKTVFKEFGDPRTISYKTGAEVAKNSPEATNEVIFDRYYYSDRRPYGIPPWLCELMKIRGYWESEKTNYFYFKNRAMPEFIVTVSGGNLTDGSRKLIENGFKQLKGSENFGKHITLEAEPQDTGKLAGEKMISPTISIIPMTGANLQDALFQGYQKNAEKAVRRSRRLSPLLLGESEDHTQATARASLIMAEEQVFAPLRRDFDEMINNLILADMLIVYWEYNSLGNNTSDKTMIARVVAPYKEMLPIHVIYQLCGEVMGTEMPDPPEEIRNMPWVQAINFYQRPQLELPEDEPEQPEEKIARELMHVHKILSEAQQEREGHVIS